MHTAERQQERWLTFHKKQWEPEENGASKVLGEGEWGTLLSWNSVFRKKYMSKKGKLNTVVADEI